jgi:hypothetical protein
MKVAIIFSEGIKQINFTPENDDEKQALKLITPNDDIDLAVKNGQFYGYGNGNNFGIEVKTTQGGYLRVFENTESIMLVLSPKKQRTEKVENAEQIAIDFTTEHLRKVGDLVSEDYRIGFKEGIEKYLTK